MKIELEEDIARKVREDCRDRGRTAAEYVNDRLRRCFMLREIKRLRAELIPDAEAAGCLTDEDILREILRIRRGEANQGQGEGPRRTPRPGPSYIIGD